MVTWNESFEIQDLVVESDEVECYLEIAFWQVRKCIRSRACVVRHFLRGGVNE